jgi:DNA gyrase inhibitor GyrI
MKLIQWNDAAVLRGVPSGLTGVAVFSHRENALRITVEEFFGRNHFHYYYVLSFADILINQNNNALSIYMNE